MFPHIYFPFGFDLGVGGCKEEDDEEDEEEEFLSRMNSNWFR